MPLNDFAKPPAEPLIPVSQAPAFLRRIGVIRSHWALREDAKAGRIAHVRLGNRLYFERAALRQFVARGRQVGGAGDRQ